MTAATKSQSRTRKSEITIAVIGLLGVIVTAVLSNWDKISPDQGVVRAAYVGYRPTDNFETELRHYMNVSGTRTITEDMQKQTMNSLKMQLVSEYPDEADEISAILKIAMTEAPKIDDLIKDLLPIYQKHFTIKEIQELNMFYSTEIMQNMTKKLPLLAQDAAPIQVKHITEFQERLYNRLIELNLD